jgi:transposase
MRGRPLTIAWQAEDTTDSLKAVYLAERDGVRRTRVHALWLLRSGWTIDAVAEVLGTHYRSVQRWVAWYREGGLAWVQERRMGGVGQPRRLSAEQEQQLGREVATGRFRTAREVQGWISQQYQVSYRLGGIYTLLERLTCSLKVPRPVHTQTDLAQQEAWKKGASSERSSGSASPPKR